MVSLEEDASKLLDFGLTYNQAKIYGAIARLHSASVGAISKMAKVRREHVYRTIPKLEKMGLIEKGLGSPAKIKAIPVEEAFSILIRQQQDEANRKLSVLMTEAREFVDDFKRSDWRTTPEQDEPQFCLISEKDAIMSKTTAVIKNAQLEINIAASRRKLAEVIFFFGELLKRAMQKGVKIQVITEIPEDGDALPRIIEEHLSPGNSFALEYANELSSHYLIVDNKEAMIDTSTETNFVESPSLWTNNCSFLALVQKSFKNAWDSSMNWNRIGSTTISDKVAVLHPRRKRRETLRNS